MRAVFSGSPADGALWFAHRLSGALSGPCDPPKKIGLTGYALVVSGPLCYHGSAMNQKLTLLGIGACVALAFSSCQNQKSAEMDDTDAETAVMIADGAVPPWLQEDTSGAPQVPAGAMTRNDVSFPEPDTDPLAGLDAKPTPPPADHRVATNTSRKIASSGKTRSSSKTRKRGGKPGLYIYTVQKGDTLGLISQQSGTSIADIKRASGLKSNTIIVGQKIKVPYKIKAPTITGKRGKASSSSRASVPTVRYAKTRSYTIKRGETLQSVAKKFGSTEKAIRNATGLKSNRVRTGQTVKIPM